MRQGDFLLIDLTDIHGYENKDPIDIINVIFTPKMIDDSIGYCKNLSDLLASPFFGISADAAVRGLPKKIMHDGTGEVLQIIETMYHEIHSADIFSPLVIRHQLVSLLLKILQPKYTDQPNAKISTLTNDILQIVAEHYNNDNLLVLASEQLNYSLPRLSSVFKQDMGIGFKDYLQNYRIDMAKRMLLYTKEKIPAIGARVGYNNPQYFSELFKKLTGVSPLQYRHLEHHN